MKNKFFNKTKDLIFPKVDLTDVKGVLIDLDNTLYALTEEIYNLALHKVYLLFYKQRPMTEDEFVRYFDKFYQDNLSFYGDRPEAHNRYFVFQKIAEFLSIPFPFLLAEQANKIFRKTILKNISCDKKALAFLRKCQRLKIPVCLVTDAYDAMQIEKLKALNVEKYITFMVSDDETGHDKPYPAMFETALAKMSKLPEQVIMIGDDTKKDIEGAQKIGIKTYQVLLTCNTR